MNKTKIFCQKYSGYWVYSDGYKWAISTEEFEKNKVKLIEFPKINKKTPKNKTIIFKITNQCNLSCKYCYSVQKKIKITKNTINTFCDFLKKTKEPTLVIFHGGEPLIEYNAIKHIVNKTNKKNITYNIQTNGTLLDKKKANFFSKKNINICISIDGPKEFHEYYREKFDVINKNIDAFNKSNNLHSICVLNKKSISDPKKLIDFYIDKKITTFKFNIIDNFKKEYSKKKIIWFYKKLYSLIIKNNKENNFKIYETKLSNLTKRLLFGINTSNCNNLICGAGSQLIAIDYKGDIYPCDYFCEYEKYKLGNISDKKMNKTNIKKVINKNISKECNRCPFKNIVDCNCFERNTFYKNKTHCEIWKEIISFLMIKICNNPEEASLLIEK